MLFAVMMVASCGETAPGESETVEQSTSSTPSEAEPVTADATGLFNPDSMKAAVAELGAQCENDWIMNADSESCIDITTPGVGSFMIIEAPEKDTMMSRTAGGWDAGGPYTSVWNDDYGFMYPDAWAGEWGDPIIQDCIAGESVCLMQMADDAPALLN
ncbi:hypothetical protein DEO23_12165 [Brachybacterium endophyticum]|uniref:Uncharacterized protein n=1 Tax=Brachybacterium endophyticum TaxID=2182385 RepID=A0A2U2RHJ3_9MICO|nr:hypothetical protein [Brachybacterium endophyticum]PWH05343.1 hypothetical protein DEO23_12165 [Brachybacterium endophyticum]